MTKEERAWIEKNFQLAYELLDPTLPEKDRRPKVKIALGAMPATEVLLETATMLTKVKLWLTPEPGLTVYEALTMLRNSRKGPEVVVKLEPSEKDHKDETKPLDKEPETVVQS